MKKILLFSSVLALVGLIYAFAPTSSSNEALLTASSNETLAEEEGAMKWYTWEEAIEANKTKKKKFFIDLYTDWCGWCKKMDKTTFQDPAVAKYLSENFYPIKFDAEQKEEIEFNGHTFKWVAGGRRGIHTLAYSLLEGKLSYPTVVYLNENHERILISPGFKQAPDMLKELKYAGEEHYKTTKWEQYRSQN